MPGKIATPEEWRAARVKLLEKEKEHTRATDALAAQVRELPWVPVTKDYTFTAFDGSTKTLKDLFAGKQQLIVYHFMFDPDWEAGCSGCTFLSDHIPDVRHIGTRNTAFTAVSRAPVAKLEAYRAKTGWKFPWVSSLGSDFNYDFLVTLDEGVRSPVEYNYRTVAETEAAGAKPMPKGEAPGLSVFALGEDGTVYHTYSTYQRGLDRLLATNTLLDLTPQGRGDGQKGTIGFKRSYEYDEEQ